MKLNSRNFVAKLGDANIRLLRIFCTVTQCGGFAAAESELQLGLPSISRYIKSLEIRLGARLCRRGRVGFSLTEQGRKVYAASLQLIADIERFEVDIRSIHSDLSGTLNLGVIDALITDKNLRIPELIRSYKTKFPRVEFNIVTATSNIVEQSVLEGALHAGIVHARRQVTKLDYRFLFQEHCNLYASEAHPLSERIASGLRAEDVCQYDFAGFSYVDDSELGPAASFLKTASVDCMEALATLISTGCFIGFLPDHYVQSVWRLKQFRAIVPELYSYAVDIELITRSGNTSPLVLALLAHLDNFGSRRSHAARRPKGASVALTGN